MSRPRIAFHPLARRWYCVNFAPGHMSNLAVSLWCSWMNLRNNPDVARNMDRLGWCIQADFSDMEKRVAANITGLRKGEPLLLVCSRPNSGKSHLAQTLARAGPSATGRKPSTPEMQALVSWATKDDTR